MVAKILGLAEWNATRLHGREHVAELAILEPDLIEEFPQVRL